MEERGDVLGLPGGDGKGQPGVQIVLSEPHPQRLPARPEPIGDCRLVCRERRSAAPTDDEQRAGRERHSLIFAARPHAKTYAEHESARFCHVRSNRRGRHDRTAGIVPTEDRGHDEDELVAALPPFKRYESQGAVRQISFYLSGEIGAPILYTDLLYTLRTAGKTDMILLHLNTPGGNFDTGLQIINNIGASEARVITILEARAYSMGAMIFLAGDELIVHDTCQLMFHNYSSALIGKGNEQQAQVLAISKWFEKVMRQVCKPFLADEKSGASCAEKTSGWTPTISGAGLRTCRKASPPSNSAGTKRSAASVRQKNLNAASRPR